MNKGLIFTLGLLIGTAGGGLLVNTMLKQQYEQKADEEIAACRNAFVEELAKRRKEYDEKSREEKKEAAEKAIQTYSPEPEKAAEMILTAGQKVVATVSENKGPYVIPPDVFDDDNNPYKRVGMMLFNDSTVLKDDKVLDLDEIDTFVGREALTHFGQYEEDRVCIRNEMLGTDYEILLIDKSYEDYIKGRSSSKESE